VRIIAAPQARADLGDAYESIARDNRDAADRLLARLVEVIGLLATGAFTGREVAMHRLHHPFEDRIENLPRFLGITIGQQLHRALEVGKEDGDLLALAFEGRFRVEDLLGEVLGCNSQERQTSSREAGLLDQSGPAARRTSCRTWRPAGSWRRNLGRAPRGVTRTPGRRPRQRGSGAGTEDTRSRATQPESRTRRAGMPYRGLRNRLSRSSPK
jgi:plasmid stabilization system protein ParE